MPPDRQETTPVVTIYPAVCERLVSLGFSRQRAEGILNAAQTEGTQELERCGGVRLLRVTYLALGRFSLEIRSYAARPHAGRPPAGVPPAGRSPVGVHPGRADTHVHRGTLKIKRTGRHASPSQVEKIAAQAGRAAPAMAIAGALVAAAPQAQADVKIPAKPGTVTERVHLDAKVTHAARAGRTYAVVQQGDTLAAIAQRLYGNSAAWTRLYQANRPEIRDPNLIYPGERLDVPGSAAGHVSAPGHPGASELTASAAPSENENDGTQPEGENDGTQAASASPSENENDGAQSAPAAQSAGESDGAQSAPTAQSASSTALSGTLSCSGLEQLWQQAGGSPGAAVTAASIAMAESSGEEYSTGPVGERGYWQVAPEHGSLSTYDPLGNARAAVAISSNGTDWTPWTTYNNGAYTGRC
ncbi:MAG: LysM peptidoglycan-binding domain-containing protein [Streptosporangiaceae bacterium]|nr:LysM peptidoglycan-binding domain-containing protein [Streptosporangiaceae bacterium]MBV9854180.1 LysM peptidoglycan-binding domain-containing protein [Streptosporangiaceae bacterium]